MNCKILSGGVIALGFLASMTNAALIINVGDFSLAPDTADQVVTVAVSGGDSVTGFQLRAVLGDGTGAGVEPIFQAATFAGGTIWDTYPTTILGGPIPGYQQDIQASVTFNNPGDSVAAVGTLVKLTISTVGIYDGSFPLSFGSTEIGLDSAFIVLGGGSSEVFPTITNGTISVPEPSAIALLALPACLFLRRRRHASARA